MAMGRRKDGQPEFWIAAGDLPRSPGHPFYEKLNRLLESSGFDRFVEDLCREHYAAAGRPSIPPGRYFRMLFVGYFEGLDSQRGIAWKCADSRSVRAFLGLAEAEAAPDHSSLTNVRRRLPTLVHEKVFQFVLKIADEAGLLKGKTLGVDSTTLEANAAMKSLVRRDTGEDYREYITRLAAGRRHREPDHGGIAPLRPHPAGQEDVQRGVEVGDRPGRRHRQDEGRNDASGVQGRARGGPSDRAGGGGDGAPRRRR